MKTLQYDASKMKITDGILIEYFSSDSEIKLPKGLIGIAENAFASTSAVLGRIVLPESLLWIGSGAFRGCASLKEITFPDHLVEIADGAFEGCVGIERLEIPESVYRIGIRAFAGCEALRSVKCVEGLMKISSEAFAGCSLLEKAELPNSLTYIDDDVFSKCDSVIIYAPSGSEAEYYAEDAGISFKKRSVSLSFAEWNVGSGVSDTGFVVRNGVLAEYNGADEVITIPDGVTVICGEVFMQNLQMKEITIPDSVCVIGEGAFEGCSGLSSVKLSGEFVYIGERAFKECENLCDAYIFCGACIVRPEAFAKCINLAVLILPDSNVEIRNNAFSACRLLSEIKLPVSEWNIEAEAFPDMPTRALTWYLSCRNTEFMCFELPLPAKVFPYAFELQGYYAIGNYCTNNGIEIGLEKEIPEDISQYLTVPEEKKTAESDDEEADEEEEASETSEPVPEPIRKSYKEQVEIAGIPELLECDIAFEGEIISNEQIIRQFMKFVIETIRAQKHNVGLAVHTGSDCFNAVLILISAIEALLLNTATSEDVVSTLFPGDYVLYVPVSGKTPSKYIYEKSDEEGRIYLKKNNRTKEKLILPKTSWFKISPYLGSSESTSNAGLKKLSSKKNEFYREVLKVEDKDVPKAPNRSIVVLLPKSAALRYWSGLSLLYRGETYKLSELATAAFYTESGVSYFPGNPAKTDPVIKFTDNVYKARELAGSSDGNKTVGVLILSADYLDRSYSELTDIISDKRIAFVYGSMPISRFDSPQLLEEIDSMATFVCTPEYIDQHLDSDSASTVAETSFVSELRSQLMTVKKREVLEEIVPCSVTEREYYDLREEILSFKYAEYDLEEKDLFVMQSLAALKILMSALFPVDTISDVLDKPGFETRLEQIRNAAEVFPKNDKDKAAGIIDTLVLLYYEIGDAPGKQDRFKEIVERYADGKIALIVPKAYYAKVLYSYSDRYRMLIDEGHLLVTTATRFDTAQSYDVVVFVSNTFGKGFAPQRCYASNKIIALLYECEKNLYSASTRQIQALHSKLNKHSFAAVTPKENIEEPSVVIEPIVSDEELDEYIQQVSNDYLLRPVSNRFWGGTNSETEIAAIVSFETGERAFLTKYYVPYVFNEEQGEIKSPEVSDLAAGDILVFNTDYFGTRDIVDLVFRTELDEHQASEELQTAYRYSQHWKQVLRDYMKSTGKSQREIAKMLKEQGITVEIPTIVGWMDEDSHTVGPRNPAAFQQIGYLVDDKDLFTNPDRYVRACNAVRSKRGEILKAIAKTMLSLLSGNVNSDEVPEQLQGLIARLAKTYRIDAIQFVERTVPVGITNHPIDDIEM